MKDSLTFIKASRSCVIILMTQTTPLAHSKFQCCHRVYPMSTE